MAMFYTSPLRESNMWSLPDAEAFYMSTEDIAGLQRDPNFDPDADDGLYTDPGWYVWACFPGCLPGSDPAGPYESEAEAIEAWREMNE